MSEVNSNVILGTVTYDVFQLIILTLFSVEVVEDILISSLLVLLDLSYINYSSTVFFSFLLLRFNFKFNNYLYRQAISVDLLPFKCVFDLQQKFFLFLVENFFYGKRVKSLFETNCLFVYLYIPYIYIVARSPFLASMLKEKSWRQLENETFNE